MRIVCVCVCICQSYLFQAISHSISRLLSFSRTAKNARFFCHTHSYVYAIKVMIIFVADSDGVVWPVSQNYLSMIEKQLYAYILTQTITCWYIYSMESPNNSLLLRQYFGNNMWPWLWLLLQFVSQLDAKKIQLIYLLYYIYRYMFTYVRYVYD